MDYSLTATSLTCPFNILSTPLQYLLPKVAKGHKIYSAADFQQRYPDGRMGSNPALATPKHGKQFYDLAVKELSNSYLEFLNGQ